MKKQLFKVWALALLAGGMGACTSDDEKGLAVDGNGNGISLVRAPEVHAYTGGHDIATLSAYMDANKYNEDWDCIPNVDLTPDELAELIQLFSKGEPTYNTKIFPYENYWVQQVYKGTDTYTPTDINGNPCNGTSITGSDQMDHLVARNERYEAAWVPENNYDGSEILVEYDHVNNFNNGNNTNHPGQCGCGIVHEGTTLMVDMSTEGITPDNQFGFHESYGSANYNNYIIIQYKGEWYVGFDYEMHKDANNPNEAKDVERDWNFTDWIVKITPAYHAGQTPETPDPETPEGPEVKYPDPLDPGFTVNPDEPQAPAFKDEVEINLLGDNKNSEYLESHLSIHVRAATDVEVFIPVPSVYYCDADDMAIVEKHIDDLMLHGGPIQTEYTIAGNIVTLNIEFVNGEDGGIRVWTEGINEEVINYCRNKYNDGITFEVWNYFNNTISLDELEVYLNQATVKFLDKMPDAYINAFNNIGEAKNPHDCTVSIVEEQRGNYNDPYEGVHYNGSPYNQIYRNKASQE